MSTKRVRIGRPGKPRITDEMITLFLIREKGRGKDPDWAEATCRLSELLGAAPFQISGVDPTSPEPPRGANPLRARAWRRSWRMRVELEADVPNHTRQEIGNQKCAAVRSPKVRPKSA